VKALALCYDVWKLKLSSKVKIKNYLLHCNNEEEQLHPCLLPQKFEPTKSPCKNLSSLQLFCQNLSFLLS